MAVLYRHTQIGWVILGVMAAIAAFVMVRLPGPLSTPSLIPVAVLALVAVLFATLTVEVDGEDIRLRFGIGLLRKRIPLAEVGGWEAVRNPWYAGWGIRLGPRGVLWNVSGFDAVELALPEGRRIRIGTDEPQALVSAITQAKGLPSPAAAPGEEWSPLPRRAFGGAGIAVLLLGAALAGWIFWSQVQPPRVTVGAEGFEVGTPFYGTSFAAKDVTAISLEQKLPRVLARTNGFAGAGTLRGHFRVEGLGPGRLYVDEGFAPYVLVRLREGFVILNFREPRRTVALYEAMARAWPDRVSAPAP
jgi:hypothetical protein